MVKKPKEEKKEESPAAPKQSKPTRPAEAPETEVVTQKRNYYVFSFYTNFMFVQEWLKIYQLLIWCLFQQKSIAYIENTVAF